MAEYSILSEPLREELKSLMREVLAEMNGNGHANGHDRQLTGLLKLKEAAKHLNQSESWVYRHWKDLGGKKIGSNIRFAMDDLEKFIAKKGA